MFNALKYTEELEKAGFTRQQAEVSMNLLIDVMNDNFATKSDLQAEVKDLRVSIRELEYRLTIKLGSMMVVGIGITATLMRMFQNH